MISKRNFIIIGSSISATAIFALIIIGFAPSDSATTYDDGILKAVIIDQLHDEIPNNYFQKQATQYLTDAGYEVDIINTANVTIDLYKKLPSLNYEFVLIRSHAIKAGDETSPVIFTGEKYTEDKYINEQLLGQVKKGVAYTTVAPGLEINYEEMTLNEETGERYYRAPVDYHTLDSSNPYFVVGSKLVDELMIGNFPETIIVIGGCSALSSNDLAQSFVSRGASTVVGWDNLVTSSDNDQVLLDVLENHLVNNMTINSSVHAAMEDFKLNPQYPANLKVFSSL